MFEQLLVSNKLACKPQYMLHNRRMLYNRTDYLELSMANVRLSPKGIGLYDSMVIVFRRNEGNKVWHKPQFNELF